MNKQLTLDLPSALRSTKVLLPTIRHGVAIFLDYDGTLTPIAEKPELAILSDRMRKTISRLASRFPVTIVSGRDIDVVSKLVGIKELGYVGSHGLDIIGSPGTSIRKEMGLDFLTELDIIETQLRQRINSINGAMVERKRFSISIHLRLVKSSEHARVEKIVDEVRSKHHSLRREDGKMLFELRPDIAWDKGKAVAWLLHSIGFKLSAALFIGDDMTDETVFRVLRGQGVGIVVTQTNRPTDACFRLRDTDEVQILLEKLISIYTD